MNRQDITFRFVVKDEELKQQYINHIATNYKFGDRGVDLIVPSYYKIYTGTTGNKIDHQIQVAGYYTYDDGTEHEVGYDLRLRSGTGAKTSFRLSNEVGTIDLYRGNIIALIDHILSTNPTVDELNSISVCPITGKEFVSIKAGTRLVQLVNPNGYGCKVEFVDELPPTERGEGGFASSGGV